MPCASGTVPPHETDISWENILGDMGSKVYFTDMNCKVGDSLLDKMERVVRAAGICDIDMERKFVAIKMHFGEYSSPTS